MGFHPNRILYLKTIKLSSLTYTCGFCARNTLGRRSSIVFDAQPHQCNVLRQVISSNNHMSVRQLSLGLTLPISNTFEPVDERPLTPSPFSSPISSPIHPASPSGYYSGVKDSLERSVSKRGTKVSTTSIDNDVKEICQLYPLLTKEEKQEILIYIARNYSTNHKHVIELVNAMPKCDIKVGGEIPLADIEALTRWEDRLRQGLQPVYHWLMTQISRLSGGVKFVVDLREDVLTLLSNQMVPRASLTDLKALDASLRDLLLLWFTVGLLNLQRITWESPCDLLQKISEYEAVHPMRNWTDLKRRVGHYRRCFIFTHSCMPNEPLVVLHTFLTNGISSNISKIVQRSRNLSYDESTMKNTEDASTITTAIFYSITSTQQGLKGIELGNYLIKRVVKELQAELPHLTKFSSLSPIPGFVKWLDATLVRAQRGEIQLLVSSEIEALKDILELCDAASVYAELRRLLKTNSWARDDDLKVLLESPLMRLSAYYLYFEKRRGYAWDPVANFHLRNGAVMWRINWNADNSPRGMDNYCGIMVNYRYFLEDCDSNSKAYLENCKITASDAVIYLAKITQDIVNKEVDQTPPMIIVPQPKQSV